MAEYGKIAVDGPGFTDFELIGLNDDNFQARNAQENFQRVEDWVRKGGRAGLRALADLLGGQFCTGEVSATQDSAVPNLLSRIPSYVVASVRTDEVTATLGVVQGLAAGGTTAGNQAAWTTDTLYVRATIAGTYDFVIV